MAQGRGWLKAGYLPLRYILYKKYSRFFSLSDKKRYLRQALNKIPDVNGVRLLGMWVRQRYNNLARMSIWLWNYREWERTGTKRYQWETSCFPVGVNAPNGGELCKIIHWMDQSPLSHTATVNFAETRKYRALATRNYSYCRARKNGISMGYILWDSIKLKYILCVISVIWPDSIIYAFLFSR